jgi:hypothetical protein
LPATDGLIAGRGEDCVRSRKAHGADLRTACISFGTPLGNCKKPTSAS